MSKKKKHNSRSLLGWTQKGNPYLNIFIAVIIVFAIWILIDVVDAFIIRTPAPVVDVVPTVVTVEITSVPDIVWWEENVDQWLSPLESQSLREAVNATNLVVLDRDYISFADATVNFDSSVWTEENPGFVEAMSITGTSVVVQITGIQFDLNSYMPFVWTDFPNTLVLIDENGTIWTADAKSIELVSLSEQVLPVTVEANPSLEIAYTKQS